MSEKIIGYLLLALGILIIVLSGLSAYSIVSKNTQPVRLITVPGLSLDLNQLVAGALPAEMQAQIPKSPPTTTELFPASALNFIVNLSLQLLLLGFFVSLGYKIAQLGTQLLRPINVQLKS